MTDSTEARVEAREIALGRLNELTTWIAVCAVAAVGLLAGVAAATIPGKASSGQGSNASTPSSTAQTTTTFPSERHHHLGPSSVGTSSGPPVAMSGGSR